MTQVALLQFSIKSEVIVFNQEITDYFRAEAQKRLERQENLCAFAPLREIKQYV